MCTYTQNISRAQKDVVDQRQVKVCTCSLSLLKCSGILQCALIYVDCDR